jgi:hypothetical protein
MPVFTNMVGTPMAPLFCEVIYASNIALSGGGSKEVLNVYHLRRLGGTGGGTADSVGQALMGILQGSLNSALSVAYIAGVRKCRFMDDPTSAQTVQAESTIGTVTGDRLPLFNSVCLRLKTDGRGRNYRGSKHWAPIAESQTLLDKLTAGGQTLWDAVATAHVAAIGVVIDNVGAYWTPIVLSTTLSQLTLNPAIFTGADITAVTANSIIGTMRRRKERSGT